MAARLEHVALAGLALIALAYALAQFVIFPLYVRRLGGAEAGGPAALERGRMAVVGEGGSTSRMCTGKESRPSHRVVSPNAYVNTEPVFPPPTPIMHPTPIRAVFPRALPLYQPSYN